MKVAREECCIFASMEEVAIYVYEQCVRLCIAGTAALLLMIYNRFRFYVTSRCFAAIWAMDSSVTLTSSIYLAKVSCNSQMVPRLKDVSFFIKINRLCA